MNGFLSRVFGTSVSFALALACVRDEPGLQLTSSPEMTEAQAVESPAAPADDELVGLRAEWRRLELDVHPTGRVLHAMCEDPMRGQIVLFGGVGVSESLGDTWVFKNGQWERMRPKQSPKPRYWHRMVYCESRQAIILFGGCNSEYRFGDTWAWDGSNWQEVHTKHAPRPRLAFGMTYDSDRRRTVLFGGLGKEGTLGDTWELVDSDWKQCQSKLSPSPRMNHCLTYVPMPGCVLAYGGLGEMDIWRWDGAEWALVSENATARAPRSHIIEPRLKVPVLFYPQETGMTEDVLMLNKYEVIPVASENGPSVRQGHDVASVSRSAEIVFFGGALHHTYYDDTWICRIVNSREKKQ